MNDPKFPPEVEEAWRELLNIKVGGKPFTQKILSVVDRAFQIGWKCGVHYGAMHGARAMRKRAANHCSSIGRSKREAIQLRQQQDKDSGGLSSEADGCDDCAEDLRALHIGGLELDALGVTVEESFP